MDGPTGVSLVIGATASRGFRNMVESVASQVMDIDVLFESLNSLLEIHLR